jgi:hypothetical protein
MGSLLKPEALVPFTFLIVPGLVAMVVYDMLVPGPRREFAKYAVELLGIGLGNLLLVSPLVKLLLDADWCADHWFLRPAALIGSLLVAPVLEAVAFKRFRTWERMKGVLVHPTPMAWDYFFGQVEPCWIRFALKRGGWVGGLYGFRSYTSSFPDPPQVYLEEQWVLETDGSFRGPVQGTAGALVSFDECEFMEMLSVEEVSHGKEGAAARAPATPKRLPTAAQGATAGEGTT